jgi:ribosomal protein S18 acetylase RimI-like enzyme
MTQHISKSTVADAEELNILINSAYRGESSKQGWTTEADLLGGIRTDVEGLQKIISKPGSILLKCSDETGKITGCVHLEKHDDKLYLGMLTVAPHLQGKGIGKLLLVEAENIAKQLQCNIIYMTVLTDRTELIAWYEKYDYVNTGIKKPFPMNDPRFGIPKKFLEFVMLEKIIGN